MTGFCGLRKFSAMGRSGLGQRHGTLGVGGANRGDVGDELHWAVGLRDLWLAVVVLILAWMKNWQALALWFGVGAIVCFGDAAIVAGAGGHWPYMAFHSAGGLICLVMAVLAALARARPVPPGP